MKLARQTGKQQQRTITSQVHMVNARTELVAKINRKTTETRISVEINIDGTGANSISTGLPFFDHCLGVAELAVSTSCLYNTNSKLK